MGDTSTGYCGIGEGGEYGIGLGLGLGVKGDRRCQGGILRLSSASSSASLWITAAVKAVRNADIRGAEMVRICMDGRDVKEVEWRPTV